MIENCIDTIDYYMNTITRFQFDDNLSEFEFISFFK